MTTFLFSRLQASQRLPIFGQFLVCSALGGSGNAGRSKRYRARRATAKAVDALSATTATAEPSTAFHRSGQTGEMWVLVGSGAKQTIALSRVSASPLRFYVAWLPPGVELLNAFHADG